MPRFLPVIALMLIFAISGAPTWAAELLEDDCAEKCSDEEQDGCPDEGCADCSIICSSCPRAHVLVPQVVDRLFAISIETSGAAIEIGQRVPVGPPPEGVFHPPRLAG